MKKILAFLAILFFLSCSGEKFVSFNDRELFIIGRESFIKGKYSKARKAFEELAARHPTGEIGAIALISVADAYFKEGEYQIAITKYETFLRLHPASPLAAWAQYQIGMCHFKMMTTRDRDPTETKKALDKYLEWRLKLRKFKSEDDKKALFLSRHRRRISLVELSTEFKETLKKLGIYRKGLGWHSLRRSTTTILHKAGLSEKELQTLGRWKSPTMPHTYILLSTEEVEEKARQVNPLFKKES